MTNRGYHIQFEKTGLNFEQSVLALQKLACFHATSVILMAEVKIFYENFFINQNFSYLFQSSIDLERFAKGTFHNDWKSKMEYFAEAYRLVLDNANELGIDSATLKKLQK